MVRAALRDSRVRGRDEPSEGSLAGIAESLAGLQDVVQDAQSSDTSQPQLRERQLEVAGLIMAGELSRADAILHELEAGPRTPPAALRHARAVWQVTQAAEPTPDEAKPLLDAAESTFRELGQMGEAKAWLNLALLYLERGHGTKAAAAAFEYLDRHPDPAFAEVVRERFALPPP